MGLAPLGCRTRGAGVLQRRRRFNPVGAAGHSDAIPSATNRDPNCSLADTIPSVTNRDTAPTGTHSGDTAAGTHGNTYRCTGHSYPGPDGSSWLI